MGAQVQPVRSLLEEQRAAGSGEGAAVLRGFGRGVFSGHFELVIVGRGPCPAAGPLAGSSSPVQRGQGAPRAAQRIARAYGVGWICAREFRLWIYAVIVRADDVAL